MSLIIGIFIIASISIFAVMNPSKTFELQTKKVEEKIKQGVTNKVDSESKMEVVEDELQETSSEEKQSFDNTNTNNQQNQRKFNANSSGKDQTSSGNNTNSNRSNTINNSNSNNTTNNQNNTTTTQAHQKDPNAIDTTHPLYNRHHGNIQYQANEEEICKNRSKEVAWEDPNIKYTSCVKIYSNSGNILGYYLEKTY